MGFNILGTPMLNNYFGVFDKSNQRVGFAPLSGCNSMLDATQTNAVGQDNTAEIHPHNDLSKGAIAGIAGAVTLAVVGTMVAIFVLLRKANKPTEEDQIPMTSTEL